jgi:hypothetical protein
VQAFVDSKHKQASALVGQAPNIARAMLQVYHGLQAMLNSAADGTALAARHCNFTPKYLTAWVQGLKR